jgi:hypothetical protein
MTLQIEFPPEVETRLRKEATRRGQDAAEYVRVLVEQHLVVSALAALKQRKPPSPWTNSSRVSPRPREQAGWRRSWASGPEASE